MTQGPKHTKRISGRFAAKDAEAPLKGEALQEALAEELKSKGNQSLLEIFVFCCNRELIAPKHEDRGVTSRDICGARSFTLSPDTVRKKLGQLVQMGLVEEHPKNPQIFRPSKAGREMAEQVIPAEMAATRQALEMTLAEFKSMTPVQRVTEALNRRGTIKRLLVEVCTTHQRGEQPRLNPLAHALDTSPRAIERNLGELNTLGLVDTRNLPTDLALEWFKTPAAKLKTKESKKSRGRKRVSKKAKATSNKTKANETQEQPKRTAEKADAPAPRSDASHSLPDLAQVEAVVGRNLRPIAKREARAKAPERRTKPRTEKTPLQFGEEDLVLPEPAEAPKKKAPNLSKFTQTYSGLAEKIAAVEPALEAGWITKADANAIVGARAALVPSLVAGAKELNVLLKAFAENALTQNLQLSGGQIDSAEGLVLNFKGVSQGIQSIAKLIKAAPTLLPPQRRSDPVGLGSLGFLDGFQSTSVRQKDISSILEGLDRIGTGGGPRLEAALNSIISESVGELSLRPHGREFSSGSWRGSGISNLRKLGVAPGFAYGVNRDQSKGRRSGIFDVIRDLGRELEDASPAERLTSLVNYQLHRSEHYLARLADTAGLLESALECGVDLSGLTTEAARPIRSISLTDVDTDLPRHLNLIPSVGEGLYLEVSHGDSSPFFEIQCVGVSGPARSKELINLVATLQLLNERVLEDIAVNLERPERFAFRMDRGAELAEELRLPAEGRHLWLSDGVITSSGEIIDASFAMRIRRAPLSRLLEIDKVELGGSASGLDQFRHAARDVLRYNRQQLNYLDGTAAPTVRLLGHRHEIAVRDSGIADQSASDPFLGGFDETKARLTQIDPIISALSSGELHSDFAELLACSPSEANLSALIDFCKLEKRVQELKQSAAGVDFEALTIHQDGLAVRVPTPSDHLVQYVRHLKREIEFSDGANDGLAAIGSISARDRTKETRRLREPARIDQLQLAMERAAEDGAFRNALLGVGRSFSAFERALEFGTIGYKEYLAARQQALAVLDERFQMRPDEQVKLIQARGRDLLAAEMKLRLFPAFGVAGSNDVACRAVDLLYDRLGRGCAVSVLDPKTKYPPVIAQQGQVQRVVEIAKRLKRLPTSGNTRLVLTDGDPVDVSKGGRAYHSIDRATFALEINWNYPQGVLKPLYRHLHLSEGCNWRALDRVLDQVEKAQYHAVEKLGAGFEEALGAFRRFDLDPIGSLDTYGDQVSKTFRVPAPGVPGVWVSDGAYRCPDQSHERYVCEISEASYGLLVRATGGSNRLEIGRWFLGDGSQYRHLKEAGLARLRDAVLDVLKYNSQGKR